MQAQLVVLPEASYTTLINVIEQGRLNTDVRVLSLVNTALEDGVQILVLIAYAQKPTPDLRQLHVGNFTCLFVVCRFFFQKSTV